MSDQHAHNELNVFRRFVAVCPLRIEPNFIDKREPPEPDILCRLNDGSHIAFELVSANDADAQRRRGDSDILESKLKETLINACNAGNFPALSEWNGRTVRVRFVDSASLHSRLKAVPRAVELITEIGPTLGRHRCPDDDAIQHIVIDQNHSAIWDSNGPSVVTQRASYIDNVIESHLLKKLEKAHGYETDHPIHLLVHVEQGLRPNGWQASLIETIDGASAESPLRHVWILHRHQLVFERGIGNQ